MTELLVVVVVVVGVHRMKQIAACHCGWNFTPSVSVCFGLCQRAYCGVAADFKSSSLDSHSHNKSFEGESESCELERDIKRAIYCLLPVIFLLELALR